MVRRGSSLVLAAMVLGLGAAPVAVMAQGASPARSDGSGAAPSTLPDGAGMTLPADAGGPIGQGRYAADVSPGSAVSFDISEGGWTAVGMPGYAIVMDRDVAGDHGELGVMRFAGTVPADPCDRGGPTEDVPLTAAAFGDWLVAQPWVVATSAPVTLDGQPAVEVDISSLKQVCADAPFMFVWGYADGAPFRLAPAQGGGRQAAIETGVDQTGPHGTSPGLSRVSWDPDPDVSRGHARRDRHWRFAGCRRRRVPSVRQGLARRTRRARGDLPRSRAVRDADWVDAEECEQEPRHDGREQDEDDDRHIVAHLRHVHSSFRHVQIPLTGYTHASSCRAMRDHPGRMLRHRL
jgi:hypothetical protein